MMRRIERRELVDFSVQRARFRVDRVRVLGGCIGIPVVCTEQARQPRVTGAGLVIPVQA